MANCASTSVPLHRLSTKSSQRLFKLKMLMHRLWEFSALIRSPHPDISSAPPRLRVWCCSWTLLICHQDSGPASLLLSCLPSSPPSCCLGVGTDGLAGKAEAPIPFARNLQPWAGSAPWTGAWWRQRRRSSENTDAVCHWCPNDWFHSSVQETVTESCWIMAHQTSVCSESIQWLPGSLTNEHCS